MRLIKFFSLLLLSVVITTSCSDDDSIPEAINEQEIITDVSLTFTDSQGQAVTYTYTDPKYRPADYIAPQIELQQGETYQVNLAFYDKSNPAEIEDITTEVKEERDEHFITYNFATVQIDLARTDEASSTNSAGIPIGINTAWTATATGTGTVEVALIHAPESVDVTNPLGTHQGGSTDVQVEFAIAVN